jgi:membrane protein implicated in regulation of membrane protease activity
MTWHVFSPDLLFLNKITIFQVKTSWEVALSYAPLATVFFALMSMLITLYIAAEARKISNEQKRIAQEKLELDLLDKRYKIIRSYIDFFSYLINNPQDGDEIKNKK